MTDKPLGQRKSDEVINESFSGYMSGTLAVSAVATLPVDAEHTPSSATFSLSGGEVACQIDDEVCEITFKVAVLGTSGNSRSSCEAWLEHNGAEVAGTRCPLYVRQTNYGASGAGEVFLRLNTGDTLRIRAQRIVGTTVCTFQHSTLTVKRH